MSVDGTYTLQAGLPDIDELREELDTMRDILLGRDPYPHTNGLLTEMEVSTEFFMRAKEIEQLIQRKENDKAVLKGSSLYHFRTGELRSFIETAKAAMERGSRRVTAAKVEIELMKEQV
jgi:hypothetical protein